MRHALDEAANSHMRISKNSTILWAWDIKLAKTYRREEGMRGGCPPAGDYYASDAGRRDEFPFRNAACHATRIRIVPA
jgi:hypothetical protein